MKNIHVLPTDKASRLIIYSTLLNEFRLLDKSIEDWKHKKHIYITSNEIKKDGEWVLSNTNEVVKFCKLYCQNEYKKIILTTDQDLIADGVQAVEEIFLNWFVKNPSCEDVDVYLTCRGLDGRAPILEYIIIIPKEEPKQETSLEEVANEYEINKSSSYILQSAHKMDIISDAKWQQERYSKEELREAFYMGRLGKTIGEFNETFKTNKI